MNALRRRPFYVMLLLAPCIVSTAKAEAVRNGPYKIASGNDGRVTVWRDAVPVVVRSYSGMFGPLPGGSLVYYASAGYRLSTKTVPRTAARPPRLVLRNGGKQGVSMVREAAVRPDGVEWTHRLRIPLDLAGSIDTGFVLNPDLSVHGAIRYWTGEKSPREIGKAGAGPDCLPYSTRFWKAEFVSQWGTIAIEFRKGDDLQPYGVLLNLAKSSRRPEPKVMILPLSQSVKKGKGPAAHGSVFRLRFEPTPGTTYLPGDRNAVLDGSFETWSNPDLPDGWRRSPYAVAETADEIGPDTSTHVHGTCSLRWRATEGTLSQVLARSGYRLSVPLSAPVTFSFYIKSEPTGVQVEAVCGNMRKTFAATAEWRRIAVTATSGTRFAVQIIKRSPGILWIDAVQLERGSTPTPYVDRAISDIVGTPAFPAHLLEEALAKARKRRPLLTGPGPDRSYYTAEKGGRLVYRVLLSPEKRAGAAVRIAISAPDGRGVRSFERKLDGRERVLADFAVADLALGEGRVSAELRAGGRVLAKREDPIVRLQPLKAGTEVKIDRSARVLLRNGHPFIPVGSDAASSVARVLEAIRAQKRNGINVIHVWSGFADRSYAVPAKLPVFHPEQLKTILDAAQVAGMAVIVHLGHWLTINHSERNYYRNPKITDAQTLAGALEVVRFARGHPALLMWYLYDEPSPRLCSPHYLDKVYRAVKQADPYHPALVNFCGSAERMLSYRSSTDLMAIDIYPVPQSPIAVIAPQARLMWEIGEWRPVLWWIQSWASIREPTAAEETCMTYQALIEGTRAILFYNYRPSSYAAWNGLGRIADEIKALTSALVSSDGGDVPVRGGGGRVVATYRRTTDEWIVLAVNRDRIPVDAALTLPFAKDGAPEEARVQFENRTRPIVGGVLHEHFAPLARHVYRMRSGSRGPTTP